MTRRLGLVLTGGGARGAYQAGVLRGIADAFPRGAPLPFRIVTGGSAGAINAVALAGLSHDFERPTDRHPRSPGETRSLAARPLQRISAADVAEVLLNAVFLDSIEGDLERMQRINRTISLMPQTARAAQPDGLRAIPVRTILPSADLGALAAEEVAALPRTLRYMLRGLGASEEKGWDLVSYLAFERGYTRRLLELGRADARADAATIAALLESAAAADEPCAVTGSPAQVRYHPS